MVKYNVRIFKLPYLNRFSAMTIYPHIYVRGGFLHPVVRQHEEVHLRQQKEQGWTYYPIYFWKWFRNMFKYGPNMKAYYAIDWEREAYVLTTPGMLTQLGYKDLDSNPFKGGKSEKN